MNPWGNTRCWFFIQDLLLYSGCTASVLALKHTVPVQEHVGHAGGRASVPPTQDAEIVMAWDRGSWTLPLVTCVNSDSHLVFPREASLHFWPHFQHVHSVVYQFTTAVKPRAQCRVMILCFKVMSEHAPWFFFINVYSLKYFETHLRFFSSFMSHSLNIKKGALSFLSSPF